MLSGIPRPPGLSNEGFKGHLLRCFIVVVCVNVLPFRSVSMCLGFWIFLEYILRVMTKTNVDLITVDALNSCRHRSLENVPEPGIGDSVFLVLTSGKV